VRVAQRLEPLLHLVRHSTLLGGERGLCRELAAMRVERLLEALAALGWVTRADGKIAAHPFAAQHLDVIPVVEGPLRLTIGALARADAELRPSVRHFLAHLHRAAHHFTKGSA